jgi:hypothetical protein
MFGSMSSAVQACFNTVTTTAESAQKVLDIGNDHISNAHAEMTRTSKKNAVRRTARHHRELQEELEADAKFAKIFADLEAEWNT